MPSKKKKYNSRFPPARIKKIMQTDEEIGKVAAAVPVLISKCLEMFLASLLAKAGEVTKSKRAKTMSRSHLKQCIMSETMFDFLKDHVANIPDVQNEDEASGSMGLSMEREPAKKVVRKRSSSKVKKTPKKRLKLGHSNNYSEDETDSGNDASENESGNEESDAQLSSSFSSPGLLSPSIQSKLEMQSTSSLHNQFEADQATTGPERKPSIHIPLDVLLSSDALPSTVNVNQPVKIEASSDTNKEPSDNKKFTDLENNETADKSAQSMDTSLPQENNRHEKQHDSSVRQGVIVANTAVYSQSTSAVGSANIRETQCANQKPIQASSNEVKSLEESESNTSTGRNEQNIDDFGDSNKPSQDNVPPVIPKPGGMLSFLYSSAPMPLPQLPATTTVSKGPSLTPQVKYAYSPLTQHRLPEPSAGLRQPLLYPDTRPPLNNQLSLEKTQHGAAALIKQELSSGPPDFQRAPNPYTYPYVPYNPTTTQRHYLGYTQSILTPPSHHLGINSHLAAHPSLHQAKPNSRAKSDDDDYDA
uniref:dr1-associated corepressor homolog n=1 Tax=Styela clava TaxID=7725 RepID=UPI00193A76D3|nr:dr1-associated corepressor homolog [Styela clava]